MHAKCVHVLSLIILVGLDWGVRVPGPPGPPHSLGYAHVSDPIARIGYAGME